MAGVKDIAVIGSGRARMTLPVLTAMAELDALLKEPVVVLYKHSTRCAFSSWAQEEVLRFAGEQPDVPIRLVDVVFDRALSLQIAERLNVAHESPQAIVLRDGAVAWHGSHREVRVAALQQAIATKD